MPNGQQYDPSALVSFVVRELTHRGLRPLVTTVDARHLAAVRAAADLLRAIGIDPVEEVRDGEEG